MVVSIVVLSRAHFVLYTHFLKLIDLDIQELQTETSSKLEVFSYLC